MKFDLTQHLYRQRAFSKGAYGPGKNTTRILNHIRQELGEIDSAPDDLEEWIDLLILSFDGVLRQGFTPEQISAMLVLKQGINEDREWPDWRTTPADSPINHIEGK